MLHMRKLNSLCLGLFLMAATATFSQTIGGDTSLNSKTWTWTGLSNDLPQTTLFTPTSTSDVLLTFYASATLNNGDDCIDLSIFWTDENGSQQQSFALSTPGNGRVLPLHVTAGSSVSVSTIVGNDFCGIALSGTYELVVSKTKLNP